MKLWYKNGEKYRNDIDPDTGLILPLFIDWNGTERFK